MDSTVTGEDSQDKRKSCRCKYPPSLPEEDGAENEDFEGEGDLPEEVPVMKSRQVLTNREVLDLNNPFNQKPFEENIARIEELLQATKQEYCELNYKPLYENKDDFQLTTALLGQMVYQDELDLAGNFLFRQVGRRLNNGDMKPLADLMSSDDKVFRLNLAYNDIGDEGLESLCEILLNCDQLTFLNLAHNDLTPAGFKILFETLMQRPPLQSLKLTGMKLEKEGFNWLICLILVGKGPFDLDISETDLDCESFQGLCSAWQSLDKDDEFPKFLVDHPLPIPLETLMEKRANNDETKKQEYNLMQRRSIIELIRKEPGAMVPGTGKIPEIPREARIDPSELVEKVSASILQGLFEIPDQTPKEDMPDCVTVLEGTSRKVDNVMEQSKKMGDTQEGIDAFKTIKETGCLPFDQEGKPIIVCPSLYSLEVETVLDMGIVKNEGHFVPDALEERILNAQASEQRGTKAPDDNTAEKAADKVVTRIFQEAGAYSERTDYAEKSDATQILLNIVLLTCQQVKDMQDSNGEFTDDDLNAIWDAASNEAARLIYSKIPPGRCKLGPDEVALFVRKFMETSNRTLLRLLENPFIPPLLFDVGTAYCQQIEEERIRRSSVDGRCCGCDPGGSQESNIKKIVMSFLEGAITTAADIIGAGDPFSFRKEAAESLPSALEKSGKAVEKREEQVLGTLEDFILAGATLAVDASNTNKRLEASFDDSIDPAVTFLEEAFDHVANLMEDLEGTNDKDKEKAKANAIVYKYPFSSRPTRLVLNRPIFQDFESIMGSKLAEFLRHNGTLRCLHLRKWDLGEEGTINLLDGLCLNMNIVLLDLGCNAIGAEGARALGKYLPQNPNLKHLILNNNRLRDPGMRYLSESLPGSGVQFLNVAYNDITHSLEHLMEILPHTKVRCLYAIGNHFTQATWNKLKYLFDSEWLLPELCDFILQEVDGSGMIVRNSQIRDLNEWYEVPPILSDGLSRAPYFEETAHVTAAIAQGSA